MVDSWKKLLLHISEIMEIIVAIFMLVILALVIVRSVVTTTPLVFTEGTSIHFYLEGALTLAITVEFIKLLCMHTPGTLLEVLMFALARHMIVEHLTPLENLVIVVAIGVLFAVRKYLLTAHDQKGMSEHSKGTKGIVEDLMHLRGERSAVSKYVEHSSKEEKHAEKAEGDLHKKDAIYKEVED